MTFKNCLSIIAVSLSIILSATSCTGGGGGSNDASGGNNPAQKQQGNNSGFKYDISGTWYSKDTQQTLTATLLPTQALDTFKGIPGATDDVKNAKYAYEIKIDPSNNQGIGGTYLSDGGNLFKCIGNSLICVVAISFYDYNRLEAKDQQTGNVTTFYKK